MKIHQNNVNMVLEKSMLHLQFRKMTTVIMWLLHCKCKATHNWVLNQYLVLSDQCKGNRNKRGMYTCQRNHVYKLCTKGSKFASDFQSLFGLIRSCYSVLWTHQLMTCLIGFIMVSSHSPTSSSLYVATNVWN